MARQRQGMMPQAGQPNFYLAIPAGAALGLLLAFSPGGVFIFFLAAMAALFLCRVKIEPKEKLFLCRLFLLAFALRAFVSLTGLSLVVFTGRILNYFHGGCPSEYMTPYLISDEAYYTLRAVYTMLYWSGAPLSDYAIKGIVKHTYGSSGFNYILASYFSAFGYSPISSRLINCLLGSLLPLLVYFLAKGIGGYRAAKISGILTAFFPSLFIWSINNLKETSFILAIYAVFLCLAKFQEYSHPLLLFGAAIFLWLQSFIRPGYSELIWLTCAAFAMYLIAPFFEYLYRRKMFLTIMGIVFFAIAAVITLRGRINALINNFIWLSLVKQRGAISEGGFCFQNLPDALLYSNVIGKLAFLKGLVKGSLHVLLEPLPWHIYSAALLVSFTQVLAWYLILFFAGIGIMVSVRHNFKRVFILLAYLFSMLLVLAATSGNIGTVFRLRDSITPGILIFAAVGWVRLFANKEQLR